MSKTIWKYQVPISGRLELNLPTGAKVLCVQMQGPEPYIWVHVDPGAAPEKRTFRWYGTGHPCEDPGYYVGTVQINSMGTTYVFHLFDDR